jgi:predicted ATPase
LLLVLDNCEHLVDTVAEFVAQLLAQCSNLRVLATSREVLGVRGEHTIAILPLAEDDAMRLFVERARDAVPGFDEATEDFAVVAEICRRLDGLPLAIELAAARLRGISLKQIADRLDDRFRLLSSTRQRPLAAVVAWSYDLLDESERAAFRRLAVFADGFDLDGAEAVVGWGTVVPADALDLVSQLVAKSLITPVRTGDDYRYRMLETLRQYGREQLDESGERDECVSHLHGWARAWSQRLEDDMRTPRQDNTLALVSRERENLRAVYEQAREAGDDELALRIVTFAPIMPMRERRAAIDVLLPKLHDVPSTLHGHAMTSCGQFAFATGDSDGGIAAAREAAAVFDSIGDRRHATWARYFEVFSAWGYLADEEFRALLEPVLNDFRELDDSLGLAYLLWVTSQREDDADRAEAQASESEALFRAIGAPFGLAHCLEGRALIRLRGNDPARAAVYLSEAIPLLADSADSGCLAHGLEAVAALLTQLDERREAAFLLGSAEELREKSGHIHRPWELHGRGLAEGALASDDLEADRAAGRAADPDALVAHARDLLERAKTSRRASI